MSQRTYYSDEARQRAEVQVTFLVGISLVLGAVIGTIVAMLFAPKSGDETREDLAHTLEEQAERGRKASEKAVSQLEHQVNDLKKRFDEVVRS
jgi:gas vesicle protein